MSFIFYLLKYIKQKINTSTVLCYFQIIKGVSKLEVMQGFSKKFFPLPSELKKDLENNLG